MNSELLSQNLQLCRQGKEQGFVWLLQQYGPRLFGYFHRLTGSETQAEDMVQEMFAKLIQKIRRYREQGTFDAWLFRVAGNLARDHARKQRRSVKTIPLHNHDDNRLPHQTDLPDGRPGPFQLVQQQEQINRIHQALNGLPELDREMIIRRHYSGLSFQQLAQQYQLPIGTVLAKVHRGLKKIKEILQQNTETNSSNNI